MFLHQQLPTGPQSLWPEDRVPSRPLTVSWPVTTFNDVPHPGLAALGASQQPGWQTASLPVVMISAPWGGLFRQTGFEQGQPLRSQTFVSPACEAHFTPAGGPGPSLGDLQFQPRAHRQPIWGDGWGRDTSSPLPPPSHLRLGSEIGGECFSSPPNPSSIDKQ